MSTKVFCFTGKMCVLNKRGTRVELESRLGEIGAGRSENFVRPLHIYSLFICCFQKVLRRGGIVAER